MKHWSLFSFDGESNKKWYSDYKEARVIAGHEDPAQPLSPQPEIQAPDPALGEESRAVDQMSVSDGALTSGISRGTTPTPETAPTHNS